MLFDSAAALRQLVDLQQQIIDTPRLVDLLQRCEELPDVKSILALTTTTSRHRSAFVDRGS